jgi:type II secretory pathway pseudopilin PulG
MNHVAKKQGFTIIELMLAMAFVSALLIAIAMTVIQIGNIYNKGITYKDVNQAGRSIASELQRSIAESASFSIDAADNHYVIQKGDNDETLGGRLCLGQYSYIWNYGKYIQSGDSRINTYVDADSSTSPIRFVKVLDPNTSYCVANSGVYPKINKANAVELLVVGQGSGSNQHDLALHSFTISSNPPQDSKTGQGLYSIEFLLGTNEQTALMGDSAGTECRPPNDPLSDVSYCSVNKFNVVARAGNTVK